MNTPKKPYVHVGSIHLYWAIGLVVAIIVCLNIGDQIGKWRTVRAYETAKISRTFEYDSYRQETITVTTIHVPNDHEDQLPWLTKPKTLNQYILCAYPEITITEKKHFVLPERDAHGYIKGSPESEAAAEAEEAEAEEPTPAPAPQPAPPPAEPQPQYYPLDPNSFATR